MKTNQVLARFDGIPTDHTESEYPDFFPVRRCDLTARNTFLFTFAPTSVPDQIGPKGEPIELICDFGLHSMGVCDRIVEDRQIKEIEILYLVSGEVFLRTTLKDIRLTEVHLEKPGLRLLTRMRFVYGRVRTEAFPPADSGSMGTIVAQWNMATNSADMGDTGPAEEESSMAEEEVELRDFRFQFVTKVGKPIPNEVFRIKLDDGSVRGGRLDEEGFGSMTQLNTENVILTLPGFNRIRLSDEEDFLPELELEVTEDTVEVVSDNAKKKSYSF